MDVEFYQDAQGDWRWRVRSVNGEIVAASSEGFVSHRNAKRNLEILADFLQLWKGDTQ